jgi:hypothetical protein
MSKTLDVVETLAEVNRADAHASLEVVDLGDAVVETKQRAYLPWYFDAALGAGWPY